MNGLVRKEIRLLLPTFAAAMSLTRSAWLLPHDLSAPGPRAMFSVLPFLLCPAMALMMALDSFGREMVSGTFVNLLTQPISRSRVWRTKVTVLAAAQGI